MKRSPFQNRSILIRDERQVDLLLSLIPNLPIDASSPIQVLIREEVKARKPDQNSLMWVGPLADIAEQGYVQGRSYSAEVWHEHFKKEYLPEEFEEGITKEGYRKWDYTPAGDRVLIGRTTQLTVRGFALYLQQVEAFGASIGVQFHANPNERRAA
jgi:hypothetical protein